MTHRVGAVILALTLAAAFPAGQSGRSIDVLQGPIAESIDQLLTSATEAGFGGAIVLEIKGRVVLQAGYGLANREEKRPFSASTTAQIGSITKTLTALAISQLAAEGRVDLKAPVKAYLPEAAEPAASSTLHELMTHTAGLANYCGRDFEPRTQAELLSVCMATPLSHARGKPAYSNMGFGIAAAVVERVARMPWEDYLRERVWQPFGMAGAGWTFPTRARSEFAIGYLNDQPQMLISDRLAALNRDSWNLKGNGGVQASAADMHRFYRGLMAQPAAVRAVLLQPHVRGEQPDVMEGYGLVYRLDEQRRPFRVGHAGSDGVFYSYFMMFPQHEAFLYFVGNSGEQPTRRALAAVLRTVQDAIGISDPER